MGSRKGIAGIAEDGGGMPSFSSFLPVAQSLNAEENRMQPRLSDFGAIERSIGLQSQNHPEQNTNPLFNILSSNIQVNPSDPSPSPVAPNKVVTVEKIPVSTSRARGVNLGQAQQVNLANINPNNSQFDNWAESNMADGTDTSTDNDTDDRNNMLEQGPLAVIGASDSDKSKDKSGDQKTLRRLAQNREAARKSRLRKKAYVQQLENSRLKLTQLEQELQRARQQGIFISSSVDQTHAISGNGALAFDMEYARWLEDHNRKVNELRSAVNAHASDTDLRAIIDSIMAHYDDIFRLKGIAAKGDVFHVLSGMWKTPAERCFLWLGGFRPSEILKLLSQQLEPLTEQQTTGISNLQQSSQQAEDALSQGMEALQQSLAETLAGSLAPSGSSGNVANYMGQMAMAMGKLGTLENFLKQADNLRLQTLQQMQRILTTRQSARAHLVITDYSSRLRALSSLWLARPRE